MWMPCDGGGGNVVYSERVTDAGARVPVQPNYRMPGYTRGTTEKEPEH